MVEGSSPHQIETFSDSQTLIKKKKNIRRKLNAVARAQLTFQMLALLNKYLYHQSQYSKKKGQQMSCPDSSNGQSIRHESEGWGFESPSGRDIFCLKNADTFKTISDHVSKMNVVACAQLTFQMLTLLTKMSIFKVGRVRLATRQIYKSNDMLQLKKILVRVMNKICVHIYVYMTITWSRNYRHFIIGNIWKHHSCVLFFFRNQHHIICKLSQHFIYYISCAIGWLLPVSRCFFARSPFMATFTTYFLAHKLDINLMFPARLHVSQFSLVILSSRSWL